MVHMDAIAEFRAPLNIGPFGEAPTGHTISPWYIEDETDSQVQGSFLVSGGGSRRPIPGSLRIPSVGFAWDLTFKIAFLLATSFKETGRSPSPGISTSLLGVCPRRS